MIKLMTFAVGAILGLKLFSKILHWMFAHHKNTTLAVLIGFMIGSLNKIWPWKQVLETRLNSHGEVVSVFRKKHITTAFRRKSANHWCNCNGVIRIYFNCWTRKNRSEIR
jgi:putative membrane protein